jgi:FMN phosphatase YigB (HAD superfamily)
MKTIVWDVDDVLNDLMHAWYEQTWLPKRPQCTWRYEELTENPPHRLLGITRDEYLVSLDAFRASSAGHVLPPVPEVLDWFRRCGHKYRHAVLTATPLASAPSSGAWVLTHFGNWVRSFNFVPSKRETVHSLVYDETKADYLRWWGQADILVDDNPDNIDSAQQLGVRGVLMPRPWNNSRLPIADTLNSLMSTLDSERSHT